MTTTKQDEKPRPESTEPAEAPREPVVGQPAPGPGTTQDQEPSILTVLPQKGDPIAEAYQRINDADVGWLQSVARAALGLIHVGVPAQTPAQDAAVAALHTALTSA